MPSLSDTAQPRTIIECIDAWDKRLCRNCNRFIESVWVPYEHHAPAEFVRSAMYCPDCITALNLGPQPLLAISPDQMRSRLGLGGVGGPLESVVRRALGGHFGGMTLYIDRWYLFDKAGQPQKGPNDPFVDRYMLLGWGRNIPSGDVDRAALSLFPACDVIAIKQDRTQLPRAFEAIAQSVRGINRNDLAEVIVDPDRQLALVYLAAVVTDPLVPGTSKLYVWDPHRAADGYVQDFQGIERVEPDRLAKQVAKLDLSSRKLLEGFMPHAGGRPPREPDLERFITQAEAFLEQHERAPKTIHEFAEFIGMPVSTLRDHLSAGGLSPWSVFKQEYFSNQAVRRALTRTR